MPGKTNVKRAKEAKERIDASKEGRKWFKAEPDTDTQIRLLPPWADHLDWPFFETKNHRLNKTTFFICPKGHDGESFCYTCDVAIPELYKGTEKDQARAYSIRATPRIFCNVLEREKESVGAQIWGISTTRYDEIVSYFSDPDYRDVTDVKKGHDFVLTRKGEGEDTSYSLRAKPTKTPVGNDDALETLFNLDESCSGPPTDEQKRMLQEALGLVIAEDVDTPAPEPETKDEVPKDDATFDFKDKDKKEAVSEKEEEPEPEKEEASGELVPIEIPNGMKGKMRDIYLKKATGQSDCFGKLFDEDADACVSECAAIIECMAEYTNS